MADLRFVTWNWNVFNPRRTADKLALLESLQPDVAALQEVSRATANALREHFPGSMVIDGLSRSVWEGERANGAALLVRQGIEVVDSSLPPLDGWEHLPGPANAVPPPESLVSALVRIADREVVVASAHPPNAAGRGADREWRVARKVRTYAALENWLTDRDPLLLGMDANAWIDTDGNPFESPMYQDNPQRPIMEFFRETPSRHGMRDAFRSWLDDHPDELDRIRARRPRGPLATTYVRGGNHPVPDRFDVVMVSPSIRVLAMHHGYEDALAAGSDHGFVVCDCAVG